MQWNRAMNLHICQTHVDGHMMHWCDVTEAWNCAVHVVSGPRDNQIFPALISS